MNHSVEVELAILQKRIDGMRRGLEPVLPHYLAQISAKLEEIQNSLAAPAAPARLVLALSDSGEAQDHVLTGLMSTVPMIAFVVDHRKEARERLSVLKFESMANPAELIEVVSDEVAEYVQCNPELTKLISANC